MAFLKLISGETNSNFEKGAIAGSKLEDFAKDKYRTGHHGNGNSSWGGSQGGRW